MLRNNIYLCVELYSYNNIASHMRWKVKEKEEKTQRSQKWDLLSTPCESRSLHGNFPPAKGIHYMSSILGVNCQ